MPLFRSNWTLLDCICNDVVILQICAELIGYVFVDVKKHPVAGGEGN